MANIQPSKSTIGSQLDAALTAAGHDVELAEADAKSWAESAWTWLKANVVHLAGYASIVGALKKWI